MKYYLIIILILLQIASFGAIYSEKTVEIPSSFQNMKASPTMLLGYKGENTQSFLKVMHTNNEIFIGVDLKDFNTSILDRTTYYKENPNYDKDRVEISIGKKGFSNFFAHYIIYPGGIIYDAYNKNIAWSNKYKVAPNISKTGWDFILIIDRKSLTDSPFVNDDWVIKVIRKSHRENIPTQSLTENIFDWTDLYFSDDETAFKSFEQKVNIRIRELNPTDETLPEDFRNVQASYLEELAKIGETKNRESIQKARVVFDQLNKEMTYYRGAVAQAQALNFEKPLPFMFSFIDCSSSYGKNKLNSYVSRPEGKIFANKGSNCGLGLIFSAYEPISQIKFAYEGDFKDNIKFGALDEYEGKYDPIFMGEGQELYFENIERGTSHILYIDTQIPSNTEKGTYKGKVTLSFNDTNIELPVKFEIEALDLPTVENVVAECDFNENFAKDLSDGNIELTRYLQITDKICRFLNEKGINSVSLDVANSDFWFNYKENDFGKWQADGKNFDLTVKTIMLAGIKNIYIKPIDSLDVSNKARVFATEVRNSANQNTGCNIFMIVTPKNIESREYSDFKELLSPAVSIITENDYVKVSYPLEENLMAERKDIWNTYINNKNTKIIVPFKCNNIGPRINADISEKGTGCESIVYYRVLGFDIDIVPSLRLKTLCDGINDLKYLSMFEDKIAFLKKNNKGNEANEGENIFMQFKDLILVKDSSLLTVNDFDNMKTKMINFINKY